MSWQASRQVRKSARRQHAVVDQVQDDRVGDHRAELLHQIQGQRRPAVAADVVEALVRVEADRAGGREAVLGQQRVGEAQERVDRVAGRAAVPRGEVEGRAGRPGLEHPAELAEVERRGLALQAQQHAGVGRWSTRASRSAMSRAAGSSLPRAGVGSGMSAVSIGDRILRLRAQRAHQQRPLVGDLGGDDRPRQAERDRAGSAKARYWSARSATFLAGAGMTAAMNLP